MIYEPRILWTIGQTLLPEHMQGLEDSLLSDVALRSSLSGLPAHGYSSIVFGNALASNGLLTIDRGVLVTRLGRLVSIGENAVIDSLNLNASSNSEVDVYIHLLPPENSSDGRSVRMQQEIAPRWRWRLHLSFDENVPGAMEFLYLGRFSKSISSEWSAIRSVCPPLINLGNPGYLREELVDLSKLLERYLKTLQEESADIQLSGENLIQVKNSLIEVQDFSTFTRNVLGEIKLHPYLFYQRLLKFYLVIANYQNKESHFAGQLYKHDALGECLLPLLEEVKGLLEVSRNTTPMVPFRSSSGTFSVGLDDQMLTASKWFILVQKPQVSMVVDLANVKFASLNRLSIVHKYFLPGILIHKVDRPVFQHFFGPEIDIYELKPDEEWRQAVIDRSVAFMDESRFEGLRFHFYWSRV